MGIFGIGSMNVRVTTAKSRRGTQTGTVGTKSSKDTGKLKRLQYNHREISNQILMAKTSGIAGVVAVRARAKLALLQKKKGIGEYDNTELDHAIIHAKKMVRIARKRMRNLKEEEKADANGCLVETEENEKEKEAADNADKERELEQHEAELRKLQDEYEEMMRETMAETMAESIEEVMEEAMEPDEMMGVVHLNLDPEDLERLKKKHRAEEFRQIMEADMKYLKSVMNRLEREKQSGTGGISLQLSGMEMPVERSVSEAPPAEAEGGNVDVLL